MSDSTRGAEPAGHAHEPSLAPEFPSDEHFEALLSSISHDLRSPLLTMSLSADLLHDGLTEQREDVVLEALRDGVRDLERMLDAISALSRARKRELEPSTTLDEAFASTDAGVLVGQTIAADGRLVREFLDAVEAGALEVAMTPEAIELAAPLREGAPELRGSPLAGLLDSLKAYAGTAIERLATIDLQARRQGGSIAVGDQRALLRLPIDSAGSANGRAP